jgi:hypothetical protein
VHTSPSGQPSWYPSSCPPLLLQDIGKDESLNEEELEHLNSSSKSAVCRYFGAQVAHCWPSFSLLLLPQDWTWS